MVYNGRIEGRYVYLMSATEEDAEFTLMVRQDPRLTRFIPQVNNTIEQQRQWLNKQRKKVNDYYFVARDYEGNKIGTIGVYDIKDGIGEGGRLTSIGNALQSIEIQYLICKFDFNVLNLDSVNTFVYAENYSALRLSKQFGAIFEEDLQEVDGVPVFFGNIKKTDFERVVPDVRKMIYRGKN